MIEVKDVSKTYGRSRVLDGVGFECLTGKVTGLFGANGAGKSTLLRILCSLTTPTSGKVLIDGSLYKDLPNPGAVVGVSLDASTMHPGRTGSETLRLTAMLTGKSLSRADTLLDQVGLSGHGGKRVKHYSLGMRQRLGIAVALMGDPSVLVLDEPVNGLDPEGIIWVRALVRSFADGGGTVLMSSHLLNEAQRSVDEIVIIDHGQVRMRTSVGEAQKKLATVVVAAEPPVLQDALDRAGMTFTVEEGHVRVMASPRRVGEVIAREQVIVLELRPDSALDLEKMFLEATVSGGLNGKAA